MIILLYILPMIMVVLINEISTVYTVCKFWKIAIVFLLFHFMLSGAYWVKNFHRARRTTGAPLYINFYFPPPSVLWLPRENHIHDGKPSVESMRCLEYAGLVFTSLNRRTSQ